jgi:hypothetical protein
LRKARDGLGIALLAIFKGKNMILRPIHQTELIAAVAALPFGVIKAMK